MNENKNLEFDPTLDALVAFLGNLPQATVKMLNVPKYRKMLECCAALKKMLEQTHESGEINVSVDRQFNLGSVTAELDDLYVPEPERFSRLILMADNFEVYPLTNGRIRFSLAFQSVLKSVM